MRIMSGVRWVVTEHRGLAGLAGLAPTWRRLFAEMADPAMWHSHEAHTAYVEHLCPDPARFCCYALSDGEQVRAILPIEERSESGSGGGGTGFPMRMWGMPLRDGWPITDAIGPEDDARAALVLEVVEHMRRQSGRPAVLALGLTRDSSGLWEELGALAPVSWFETTERHEFVIPTDMTGAEFVARLSSKTRHTLRKATAAFEAMPGAEYRRTAPGDGLVREYERFLEVEASGWKGVRGSSIKQQPVLAGFYRALLEDMSQDGHGEIHSLYADGACIAAGLCFYTRGMCVVLKSGYDESYSRFAPGKLLAHTTLRWCCEDPSIRSASEVTDAPWLLAWHPGENCIRRAYVSLRPVSGLLALTILRLWYGPIRSAVRTLRTLRRRPSDPTQRQPGRDSV